jgi:hypothetical protein
MKLTAALAALLSVANAINSIDFANTEVFESLRDVPEGWQSVGAPDASSRMKFRIALRMVCVNASISFCGFYGKHYSDSVCCK